MKDRRTHIIVVAVVLMAVATWILVGYSQRMRPSFPEAAQFIRAVHKYSESRKHRTQPPPAYVELSELVEGGYITAKDARWFEGATITFTAAANLSYPQEALIRVQFPDGRVMVMSVDGSVSQLPR